MLRQRILGLALGYEDVNDHERLRIDPLIAAMCGRADVLGEERHMAQDKGRPLAGKSTLNRLDGSDRALYADAQGLQCIAGTAPVSYQSGQIHKVNLRRAGNKNLRATMHYFTVNSRAKCAWAAVYYTGLREAGKSHAQALRCLGQRWLKIIWKMWQTGTCYDPDLHTRNQLAHGSWVLQINPQ